MTSLRAVFTVTVETRPDGDYYFDHADFVRHVGPWIEGGLYDRDDIRTVTITEQPAAVLPAPADRAACNCDAEVHIGAGFYHQPQCATRRSAAPIDRATVLERVIQRIGQMADAWEQQLPEVIRTPAVVSAIRAALEAADDPSHMAGEAQQPDTQAEDPARIDHLRPEFFEYASVESIDVQIQRAQRQQRQWGNRVQTLTILRQARVMQKELGEWPAAVSQPGKEG